MSLNYEEIFVGARKSQKTIQKTEIVLDVLRSAAKPMTCKEIGTAIMSEEYSKRTTRKMSLGIFDYTYYGRSGEARSWSSFIGRVMKILSDKGIVKTEIIDGEPVTIEVEEWVDNPEAPPRELIVHDDDGNDYKIPNPKYDYLKHGGTWEKVKKTITPKVKVYSWVG